MAESLLVNEIYLSLQGESTFAGLPCVFIRLTACNLRCSYCDTVYAFNEGVRRPIETVLDEVRRLALPFRGPDPTTLPPRSVRQPALPLVELTGGEPLLQPGSHGLMTTLCDAGFTVLLETSGALDIAAVDPRVHRIMDLKCPSSGESARNRWENLAALTPQDEIKFVIGTEEDYRWAVEVIHKHQLAAVCPLLFSWVHPLSASQASEVLKPVPAGHTPLTRRALADRIIADALPVRFQAQLHKLVWPAEQRGV